MSAGLLGDRGRGAWVPMPAVAAAAPSGGPAVPAALRKVRLDVDIDVLVRSVGLCRVDRSLHQRSMEGADALERPHHLAQVFRRGLVPDHAGRHLQR